MIQPTIGELEKKEVQPKNQIQSASDIPPKIEVQPHTNSIGTWLLASTADNTRRNAESVESSSSLTPRKETKRLSLVTQVSWHIDAFLRQQGASDLMMP
jgi:hypothetical protein